MIRDEATARQVAAADPVASTWLSANAGSGKTRVLTDRVARLLLRRVAPQNILCLTYTKAAAAEMQNRLFQRLGSWAMKADAPLRADLATLGIDGLLSAQDLDAARTLFARAIETPGGLKIQTIHAFCGSILRRFPLEAGVSPQFQEIEDRTAELMQMEVVDEMAGGPDRPIVHAFLSHFTGADLPGMLAEISGRRGHFAQPVSRETLAWALGIPDGVTEAGLLAEVFSADHCAILRDLAAILPSGKPTDQKAADKLSGIDWSSPGLTDLARLESVLLFSPDPKIKNPSGPKIGSFPTKAPAEAHASLIDDLADVMQLVADRRGLRLSLQALARNVALHDFAHRFVTRYAARKQARGLLDFDDLIDKASQLLTDKAVADWVLYRLDGGIDHLLVDEAQDTSPAQWTVIENLTRELTSGTGARSGEPRTIFVVGDKKQSIYSFQGADPAAFDRMRAHYASTLAAPGPGLQGQSLEHSFRSSQAILRVVDNTFADAETADAIGGRDSYHYAFQADLPGRVDLWPVIPPSEEQSDTGESWSDPVDLPRPSHPDVLLAQRIVSQIRRMIAEEKLPEIKDGRQVRRSITEGDILILVQRRSTLFSEIIRACKAAGLRVAGADRFRVGAVLAVKDIAALLSFLALPEDDLSLAAALRSPLFGWSEQDLFTLAHGRPETAVLWEALRNSGHAETLTVLHDLLKSADFMRPFDLIDRILTRHGGRRKLLARLGAEAEDGIDAMLSQAMAYETQGVPSLTGFLSWMETDALEVKRQMDNQGDQVRVMSVHGAKGLEAPIVILPDCAELRNQVRDEVLTGGPVALWKVARDAEPPALAALRAAQEDAQARERLRLLYVAMTRAKSWLIVAAAGNLGDAGQAWHDRVSVGMDRSGATDAMAGDLPILRVTHAAWDDGPVMGAPEVTKDQIAAPRLDDLAPPAVARTLSPSDLGGAKALAGETDDTDAETLLARGRLLHSLLEHQPADADAAARIIAASPESLAARDHALVVADALRVLAARDLAHVFAPGTLAEVGITADLPGIGRIHGSIDRLVIGPDRVLAIDFKSNRIVPADPGAVPEGLLRQLGAYAAALAQVYPDRRIDTAILWTSTGQLMPVPPPIVAAALDRVTIS